MLIARCRIYEFRMTVYLALCIFVLLDAESRFCHRLLYYTNGMLRLQTIKTIVNSCKFKGSSSDEPRRVQVLDLYCLTRFESEGSGRGDVY